MLPLPPELAGAHARAVNHLFGVPVALLAATRRFSGVLSATGHDAIHHHSRHLSQLGHGQTFDAAEHTLRGVDAAATHSLAMAKKGVRNISQHLGESNPSKRPDSRGRKTS
jgi:hypothetical protein